MDHHTLRIPTRDDDGVSDTESEMSSIDSFNMFGSLDSEVRYINIVICNLRQNNLLKVSFLSFSISSSAKLLKFSRTN